MNKLLLLMLLLICHYFADFVFQSDRMAYGKNRHNVNDVHWMHWLTSHAVVNGALIYFIIGCWYIALIEVIVHWTIDFMKCEKFINVEHDQLLHIISKIIYIYL